jgi:hypothetical protein
VASKEVAVKKYVVRLIEEERARLDEFVRKGKRAGRLLTKARILLKRTYRRPATDGATAGLPRRSTRASRRWSGRGGNSSRKASSPS